jgi:alpha-beta hydrolase superfamily lysophospholipase
MWATILSQEGYASFRYDKRAATYAHLYQSGEETCSGITDEYLTDILHAINALENNNLLHSPLVLLGHSLGAIAALAFSEVYYNIQAVAAISAPVEDLHCSIKRQLRQQLSTDEYDRLVKKLDAAVNGAESGAILGLPATYWRDYARYPLERLLRQSATPPSIPLLLLHGSRDTRVPIEHVQDLKQGLTTLTNIQWKTIAGGDHYLMIRPPASFGDGGDYKLSPLIEWLEQLPSLITSRKIPM